MTTEPTDYPTILLVSPDLLATSRLAAAARDVPARLVTIRSLTLEGDRIRSDIAGGSHSAGSRWICIGPGSRRGRSATTVGPGTDAEDRRLRTARGSRTPCRRRRRGSRPGRVEGRTPRRVHGPREAVAQAGWRLTLPREAWRPTPGRMPHQASPGNSLRTTSSNSVPSTSRLSKT